MQIKHSLDFIAKCYQAMQLQFVARKQRYKSMTNKNHLHCCSLFTQRNHLKTNITHTCNWKPENIFIYTHLYSFAAPNQLFIFQPVSLYAVRKKKM